MYRPVQVFGSVLAFTFCGFSHISIDFPKNYITIPEKTEHEKVILPSQDRRIDKLVPNERSENESESLPTVIVDYQNSLNKALQANLEQKTLDDNRDYGLIYHF